MIFRKKIITIVLLLFHALFLIGCKNVTSKTEGTYYLKTLDSFIEESYIRIYENNTADVFNVKINESVTNLKNCKLDIQNNGKMILIYHDAKHIATASFDGKVIRLGNLNFAKK